MRNHTLSCTVLCVASKVNFIMQLLKGGKISSKVFIACKQVIPALYNPATKEILMCISTTSVTVNFEHLYSPKW